MTAPQQPHRSTSARRGAPGSSPRTRDGRTRDSTALAGSTAPLSCSTTRSSPSRPCRRAADALPPRRKRESSTGRDRLDLGTQRGERATTEHAQHLGVAVLGAAPAGRQQLALDDATRGRPGGRGRPWRRRGPGHGRGPPRRHGRVRACGHSGRRGHPAGPRPARGTPAGHLVAGRRRARPGAVRRPRSLPSGPPRRPGRGSPDGGRETLEPGLHVGSRGAVAAPHEDGLGGQRSEAAQEVEASSASRAARSGVSRCSSASVRAICSASRRSRRARPSPVPRSSASRDGSRASAAARRSASGESPS